MWVGIIAGLTVAAVLLGARFLRITASWREIRQVAAGSGDDQRHIVALTDRCVE
jgi:hypothetical protein